MKTIEELARQCADDCNLAVDCAWSSPEVERIITAAIREALAQDRAQMRVALEGIAQRLYSGKGNVAPLINAELTRLEDSD